ncbi:MAG: PIN domain-containing protein [Spirochaetales bacterium]|nr:PIN domain-containing protein [Spirochaetales bacterium]
MTLVDTSIWILVFRKRDAPRLEDLVDLEDIVTGLPVVQEVLQGFREEHHWRIARDALMSFPIVESPMEAEVFLEAASLHRSVRRAGLTVRSSVDCLIASCALRNDLEILHHDRDFSALARIAPLTQREA